MIPDRRETWLMPYLRVQKKYDPKVEALLRSAASDSARAVQALAGKPGIGAEVRRRQLLGAESALRRALAQFWRNLRDTVRAGQEDAAAAALAASFDWDEALLSRTHPDAGERRAMREYLIASADRNVEAMLARALGGGRLPLSQQVYRTEALANGWVERTINSSLAQGASATEMAQKIRKFVSPSTPGGVSYAAMRLARTEINNAYHAQSIGANADKPWNTGMIWNLSRSHSEPDICDTLAKTNQHNLGTGVFPLDNVPRKPHPQCFCYVVPKTVSEAEFERRFRAGAYDSWMRDNYRNEGAPAGRSVA